MLVLAAIAAHAHVVRSYDDYDYAEDNCAQEYDGDGVHDSLIDND